MFLKTLIISAGTTIIREIPFRKGINLIVDESDAQVTGNDVGKTSVLRLIDFCLGAKPGGIYVDPESKKDEYLLVKQYLQENEVLITLILKDNLDISTSREIVVERNFLQRTAHIRKIDNVNYTEDGFYEKLTELIFPNQRAEKPTFRQIISHNIRYDDDSVNNTLRTLGSYGSDVEYETLHLFMLGCDYVKGNRKQELLFKLRQEETFRSRLEKTQTKTGYETALAILEEEIDVLQRRKSLLNINKNYEAELDKLNQIKLLINKVSNELGKLFIRKELINEAREDLEKGYSQVDAEQLQEIYEQAGLVLGSLHKKFSELLDFHNQMIEEKVGFITKSLPRLNSEIETLESELRQLLNEEEKLTSSISKGDSFKELESLIIELTEKHQLKGEYESIISQLDAIDEEMGILNKDLNDIDNELFSDEFESQVKSQIVKFNKFFSSVSNTLYGESYALKYDIKKNSKGQKVYKFSTFNTNLSSGKKQGEISCFDIAYTFFADDERIPCLHFILNDKKELMHDNQLVAIARLVAKSNVQFVASILRDKLPVELNKEAYFVVKLSRSDKLFRIE
jgi:uncharacterized protein YydD (DUF2326 family)